MLSNLVKTFFPISRHYIPTMSKQETKKKDLADNPIYLFWEADGQDLYFFFEVSKVYSYPTLLF